MSDLYWLYQQAASENWEAIKAVKCIAALEAENKRLEKENNHLRDTVGPRTDQVVEWAAKYKALRELGKEISSTWAGDTPKMAKLQGKMAALLEGEE